MKKIQQGKRRGTSRAEEGLPELSGQRIQGVVEDILESEKDVSMRRTTVIDRGELRRIYNVICGYDPAVEEIKRVAAERKEQYELSKKLRVNFPGCSAGGREEKLERMRQMEADAEAARCEIDRQEAEFQAQRRHELMEDARKMLNWGGDRYKNFHTAMQIDETTRERNKQMDLKKQMAIEKKLREKDDSERQRLALQEVLDEEARVAAAKQKERMDNAAFQKYQMKEHEDAHQREIQDGLNERDQIQKAFKEYLADTQSDGEGRRARANKYRLNLHEHMNMQMEKNRRDYNITQEEDKERLSVSLAKRQLMHKRVAKEKELKDEKDVIRTHLYNKLTKYFKEKGDNYNELVCRARLEEDARIKEEEDAKAEKRRIATEDQLENHLQQMKEHEDAKIREKEQGKREATELAEAALIFAQGELEKRAKQRDDMIFADLYNRRKRVRDAERVQEKRNQSLAIDWFDEMNNRKKEREFQEYADRTIQEMRERKGPTYAMEKEKANVMSKDRTCGNDFLGKGPLKPEFMTDEEMAGYIERLNIKEDQQCLERMRGREDSRYTHCKSK